MLFEEWGGAFMMSALYAVAWSLQKSCSNKQQRQPTQLQVTSFMWMSSRVDSERLNIGLVFLDTHSSLHPITKNLYVWILTPTSPNTDDVFVASLTF